MIIETTDADIERATAMMADLCAPMTDMVLQDAVAYFAAHRLAAYAAGKADERERVMAILKSHADGSAFMQALVRAVGDEK